MEVRFSPELESKVADIAAREGRNPDEFVQELVARYFDEERRLLEAVSLGDAALDAGQYLTHEQVVQRLERFLRP
jgi:predicted transcriptional regulator